MTFTQWLVEKGYTTSEDKETIESELSFDESERLYKMYEAEHGDEEAQGLND